MFSRSKLIILEEPEYGLGPRSISTMNAFGSMGLRYTDKSDPKRGDKAMAAIRRGATKIRERGIVKEPEEMRFDKPRGKPDTVRLY